MTQTEKHVFEETDWRCLFPKESRKRSRIVLLNSEGENVHIDRLGDQRHSFWKRLWHNPEKPF